MLEGRAFVLPQLKKLVLGASGGYAVGLYLVWQDWALWRVLEAIELVSAVQEELHDSK